MHGSGRGDGVRPGLIPHARETRGRGQRDGRNPHGERQRGRARQGSRHCRDRRNGRSGQGTGDEPAALFRTADIAGDQQVVSQPPDADITNPPGVGQTRDPTPLGHRNSSSVAQNTRRQEERDAVDQAPVQQ